jgi:murein L,D-transpeptidase YafK
LAAAALRAGQERIHVHVFPFRMTAAKLDAHKDHPWREFWGDLKAGYDSFERTNVPPRISMCDKRYLVQDGERGESGDPRALASAPQNGRATEQCTERIAERTRHGAAASESRSH